MMILRIGYPGIHAKVPTRNSDFTTSPVAQESHIIPNVCVPGRKVPIDFLGKILEC